MSIPLNRFIKTERRNTIDSCQVGIATGEEKGMVALCIVGEDIAGESYRDPFEQLAGCRSRQDEEAKNNCGRNRNADRGDRVAARTRREGGCYSSAGRW